MSEAAVSREQSYAVLYKVPNFVLKHYSSLFWGKATNWNFPLCYMLVYIGNYWWNYNGM
ncbi:hypothetical protein PA25_20140 [Pseudoalteromonas sp. A25]|nr:hypothetical protein PA25_20140 [Pseudoalteromonas sp. A25]